VRNQNAIRILKRSAWLKLCFFAFVTVAQGTHSPFASLLQPREAAANPQVLPNERAFMLRGTFNGWHQDAVFQRTSPDSLQVVVTLFPGRHEFKIADSDWMNSFTLDAAGNTNAREAILGRAVPVVRSQGPGDNSTVEIRTPGSYLFRLDNVPANAGGHVAQLVVSFGGPVPRAPLPFEPSAQVEYLGFRTAVRANDAGDGLRSFDLFTDAPQREVDTPARTVVNERPQDPRLRSGNALFDALFGLSVREAVANETRSITDYAFNRGSGIACDCYVTGEKWGYVWTRDISYASELGLGWLNPDRTWNSLAFKTSVLRFGTSAGQSGLEIVQDTGTGGSWPVSTDRVTWALGAGAVLDGMPVGAARGQRLAIAFDALRNTLERDRADVFDPRDGLYRGEQSFLDWREQSYPLWTKGYVSAIADGKALSTNVVHLLALVRAEQWARELGLSNEASRYAGWAQELRAQVRSRFLDPSTGLLASLRLGTAYPVTLPDRQDLLGLSLAVLAGVLDENESRTALEKYPVTEAGAPVVWPQSPEVPIYHNRAIWPFVTAYASRAGARARHAPFVARQLESVYRGTALNLSNMENLEFTSGMAFYYDGQYTGPVINSRRQLWSVASFLSIVRDTLFGLEVKGDALSVKPFVPASFAARHLPNSGEIKLENLPVRGKRINVVLRLPERRTSDARAAYDAVSTLRVDGIDRGTGPLSLSNLAEGSLVEIILAEARSAPGSLLEVLVRNPFEPTVSERASYLAPVTPSLRVSAEQGAVRLELEARGAQGAAWDLYRNGRLTVRGFEGTFFLDREPASGLGKRCYVAVQRDVRTSLPSQPSGEACLYVGVQKWNAPAPMGAQKKALSQQESLENFGFSPQRTGPHLLTLQYSNSHNDVSTGITAATRRVRVVRESDGAVVATAVVTMPHLPRWESRAVSSGMVVPFEEGRRYRVVLDDAFNMTYLSHYVLYDGAGGRGGPLNSSQVHEVFISPLEERIDFRP
jgi:hypothetical protein